MNHQDFGIVSCMCIQKNHYAEMLVKVEKESDMNKNISLIKI